MKYFTCDRTSRLTLESEMNQHLFKSELDGALYDTRQPNWAKSRPLRPVFARHVVNIKSTEEFKATLRAGAYTWPGGYSVYLITSDGAALCHSCARKEARNVIWSIANKVNDGWRVVGTACTANDDESVCCDHCSKEI